jgi:predicted cation transporter
MNLAVGVVLIDLLLLGPVVSRTIEEHIELFFLAIGLLAMTLAGAWRWEVASRAAEVPLGITLTVIVADVIFGRVRGQMDRALGWIQARIARPIVCGGAIFVIALLSAMLTAIVAALMLAELVELMRLGPRTRVRVTVAGCFAIGLGSALTPLGGPLSTLAASGLGMGFGGLFAMLAPYVLPGMFACAIVAGRERRRGDADRRAHPRISRPRSRPRARGLRFHRGIGTDRGGLCAAGGALRADVWSVGALLG